MGATLGYAGGSWTSTDYRGNGGALMPVHKHTLRSGKIAWFYKFNLPGSTREHRHIIRGWGFVTKREAEDAERTRYFAEQQKIELAKAGARVAAAAPQTLSLLLEASLRLP